MAAFLGIPPEEPARRSPEQAAVAAGPRCVSVAVAAGPRCVGVGIVRPGMPRWL